MTYLKKMIYLLRKHETVYQKMKWTLGTNIFIYTNNYIIIVMWPGGWVAGWLGGRVVHIIQ